MIYNLHRSPCPPISLLRTNNHVDERFVFLCCVDKSIERLATGARTFEGYVESEATVKVANMMDPHYRAIMKERTRQQKEGRSKIKMMNESESTRSQRVIPQKTGGVSLSLQNRRVKNSINERIPKEELIEFLFGLFEQYAKWNMKGLKEKTKQPTVPLPFLQ